MNRKGFIDLDTEITESPAVIALALLGGGIAWFMASKMTAGPVMPILIGVLGAVAGFIIASIVSQR